MASRTTQSANALAASAINVGDAVKFKADSQTIGDGTISKVQDGGRRLQVEFTDKGVVRKRWITHQQILTETDVKSQVLAAVKAPAFKMKSQRESGAAQLTEKLQRRQKINDGEITSSVNTQAQIFNPFTQFPEFSREEIKNFQTTFKKYDSNKSKSIDESELTKLFEDLECPQTHMGIRKLIKEVDMDKNGEVSFCEFLQMFKNAKGIEAPDLHVAEKRVTVNVQDEGVGGAKNFFAAKIAQQSASNKVEDEIKAERDLRRQAQEEKKKKREAFKAKQGLFK